MAQENHDDLKTVRAGTALAGAIVSTLPFFVVFHLLVSFLAAVIPMVAVNVFHYPDELFNSYWWDMGFRTWGGQRGLRRFDPFSVPFFLTAPELAGPILYVLKYKAKDFWRFYIRFALCYGGLYVSLDSYIALRTILDGRCYSFGPGEWADAVALMEPVFAILCAMWRPPKEDAVKKRRWIIRPRYVVGGLVLAVLAGLGVWGYISISDKMRFETLRKAAETGDPKAEYALAEAYYHADPFAFENPKAAPWYKKAAEQGYAPAQARLGDDFQYGFRGMRKDRGQAEDLLKKAAAQGNVNAMYLLGSFYTHIGDKYSNPPIKPTPEEYAQAAAWYKKAAELGNRFAQANLGVLYHNGTGVKKDYAEAAKWYQKAADQGAVSAQYNLSNLYRGGLGVLQDNEKAYYYLYLSAVNGKPDAVSESLPLLDKLTPEVMFDLQKRARAAWKERSDDE